MSQQARIVTAAHVYCYINGRRFGRVFSFQWGASTPSEEIDGIDCVETLELAPTRSKVQAQMGIYRTIGDGGIEGPGIQPSSSELQRGKYFSVMLIERLSDTVLFQAEFCKVDSQSWSVVTKDFMKGSVSFKALTWSNEVRPLRR